VRAEEEGTFDDADDDAGPYVRGDLESHPLHDDRRRLLFSTARCVMHFGSRTHAKNTMSNMQQTTAWLASCAFSYRTFMDWGVVVGSEEWVEWWGLLGHRGG
jgi:hypothetical protein